MGWWRTETQWPSPSPKGAPAEQHGGLAITSRGAGDEAGDGGAAGVIGVEDLGEEDPRVASGAKSRRRKAMPSSRRACATWSWGRRSANGSPVAWVWWRRRRWTWRLR